MGRGYARRRDDNEPEIVAALRSVGATVQTIDETGAPDLLVGFRGVTYLLEVKDPVMGARNSRRAGKHVLSERGLRDTQEDWWRKWRGAEPRIVTSVDEALAAIGCAITRPR